MAKSRKRNQAERKRAAKAAMKERNSAAKTVKEQKPSHFCWEFFSPLFSLFSLFWTLGRKRFGENSGSSGKKKEPTLSPERADVASSSSALVTSSGVTVAAKRASEEQSDGPAEEMPSLGTVNDKDLCHAPNSTGNSNEALPEDPEEVIKEVISSTRRMDGDIVRVGYHKKEEAEVNQFERLPEIEVNETKSKRPGSDSGDWKQKDDDMKQKYDDLKKKYDDLKEKYDDLKEKHDDLKEKYDLKEKHDDLKEKYDDLKEKYDDLMNKVVLRRAYSDFEKTKEFEDMNNGIKEEVLKLLKRETWKNREFKKVVRKTLYTKILRTMHFQKVNMALKSSFRSEVWRKEHRFPTFSDHAEYTWWEENFDPEKLEKRLGILREAAKNWNSEQDIFMVIELVMDLNLTLHPQISGMGTVEMFRLATTICSVSSDGDRKI